MAGAMGNVLVVDDDAEYCQIVAQVLRDLGCSVRTATDGAAALALLQEPSRPDLILLDLVMPTMDGVEFLGRLRDHPDRRLARVPVVVMTGMPHHAPSLLRPYSADGLLVKPFAVRDLAAVAAQFCRGAAASAGEPGA